MIQYLLEFKSRKIHCSHAFSMKIRHFNFFLSPKIQYYVARIVSLSGSEATKFPKHNREINH